MNDLSIDLVRRIKAGDDSAWESFYLAYRDRLLCSIRLRLGADLRGRLDSEDILHSVVREAFDDLGRFQHDSPGALSRYLHVCVLNKIRRKAEHFGAAKRAGTKPLSDSLIARIPAHANDDLSYLDASRFDRIERALETLPERTREVVLLRVIEGLSNGEVATELKISVESASKTFHRALARLAVAGGLGTAEP